VRTPICRFALLSASVLGSCVTPHSTISHARKPIVPAPEVLSQAAAAHFPYLAAVRAAEQRDGAALLKLIRFSTRTDAFGSIAHGAVLLDLGEIFGVAAFDQAEAQASEEQQAATKRSMNAATSFLNGPSRPNRAMQPTARALCSQVVLAAAAADLLSG